MANACGSCHLMSGQGHPESADLAGMPPEYIIRQMTYFKSGARNEETRMGPIARASSDEDVREATDRIMSAICTQVARAREIYPQALEGDDDGWWVRTPDTARLRSCIVPSESA